MCHIGPNLRSSIEAGHGHDAVTTNLNEENTKRGINNIEMVLGQSHFCHIHLQQQLHRQPTHRQKHNPMVARILDKAVAGERLTPEEGLALLESHDLAALGRAADAVSLAIWLVLAALCNLKSRIFLVLRKLRQLLERPGKSFRIKHFPFFHDIKNLCSDQAPNQLLGVFY